MPDAPRKWLERYEKMLARGIPPDSHKAVSHLRRLLEQNERLVAEVK